MERLLGLDYVTVKNNLNTWFRIWRAVFGVTYIIGVCMFVYDFFKIGKEPVTVKQPATI
ncbi:MAG: hypothetical protein HQK88_10265 [Nitrospirae bacterium]|nr:hypothetical protein [Nitrospirota bacterium]MBF0534966.1 hypothetical protein [Nitrospirota bacterium]MBF0617182.1 hypothetical protein [Nitrospirota bacterium]